ncbi:phosphate acetyltransferase [Nitratireductor indicus]|uniref:phosphate acetyltransferase n=1 Tax=Nitratireductor indicus TaxID=721133 RepID=UPI00287474CC|nr:phosphate acetyltransferase [Nitratireductor indicus]MDS1136870.1 phosphate acetyltransferase [Nitratireductor indicus]
MKPLLRIYDIARTAQRYILLPEGDDPRIQRAAVRAVREGLARVTLLGDPSVLRPALEELGAGGLVGIIDPDRADDIDELAREYHRLRAHKGVSLQQARAGVADPMIQAALRVRLGQADGTVGGASHTTSQTLRAALQLIGPASGVSVVSSFFLMLSCETRAAVKGGMIFADCGLNVLPDAGELASIARASAVTCRQLLNEEPRVAMLSFSTAGSAEHASLGRIRQAVSMIREAEPDLEIDGELQFDAAIDDAVRKHKAPMSRLSARPNVFIFPDLASGNIGYKIAQRLGGLDAIGPILQGLALPANDLSRGCSVDDVLAAIAITAVQAASAGTVQARRSISSRM